MSYKGNIYYDISLDNHNFRLDLFQEKIINKKINNKLETFRTFNIIDNYYVNDLEKTISKLQKRGYINGSKVVPETYNGVEINSPSLKLKLLLLRNKIKVLEKIYTYDVIDKFCYLKTYMVYINLDNGLLKAMYLTNHGTYNEEKVSMLQDNGYVFIKDSLLNEYLNVLGHQKELVLERKNPSK